MKKVFHTDVDLYLLKICAKFLEKVDRNKGVKDILSWKLRYLY